MPEVDPFSNPDIPCPLTKDQIGILATYNAEVARGLLHRPGYAFEMARLQEQWDNWTRACLEAYGDVIEVDHGLLVYPKGVKINGAAEPAEDRA